MNHDEIQLRNIDPDDVGDVMQTIENSFGFKFTQTDLDGVYNFGQFCDAVLHKINLPHAAGCTSQQAFYKMREALMEVTGIDKASIIPSSKLQDLFPKGRRRKDVKRMEAILGVSLKILKPKDWVTNFLTISLIVAFVSIFLNWQLGLLAFMLVIVCIRLANYFGMQLKIATVGEATEYFASRHYKKARTEPYTVNKTEVAKAVKELFMQSLYLPEGALTRDASFN